MSFDLEFEGYVAFTAKTHLVNLILTRWEHRLFIVMTGWEFLHQLLKFSKFVLQKLF